MRPRLGCLGVGVRQLVDRVVQQDRQPVLGRERPGGADRHPARRDVARHEVAHLVPHVDALAQLGERLLPRFVSLEERVVLQRVLGPLDVHLLQGVCGQIVVLDVLRRDAEERDVRHTKELVYVGGVARADLQRAIDVGDAVRVAIDEGVDRQLALVGEAAHEAACGSRGYPGHGDQDAVRFLPELVALQPLEHAAGLDAQDELRFGLEGQMLDQGRDRIGP